MVEKVLAVFVWLLVRLEHNYNFRPGSGFGIFPTSENVQQTVSVKLSCSRMNVMNPMWEDELLLDYFNKIYPIKDAFDGTVEPVLAPCLTKST